MPQPQHPPRRNTSLSKRRVRYPAGKSRISEGFVTRHDRATATVIVLDDFDGSFWRGPDADIEVIV
jgi:hypothetical protein